MRKITKEWYIRAPWGNIALISWGNPNGEPIFLVHGRQDSAATFVPLIDLLPEKYYYIGIDLPGNGRSDQFPVGLPLSRYYYIGAIDIAVKHLKWDKFVYIGHSMGCELGLFYNAAFPGHIKKFVFIDPIPSFQRLQLRDPVKFYEIHYGNYYNDYNNHNFGYKIYSKRKVLDAVKKARGLNERQAEIILSRNLICLGDDKYRLSWDKRTAIVTPQNYENEIYAEIFSKYCPPCLYIHMTEGSTSKERLVEALELLDMLNKKTYAQHLTLKGGHDGHIVAPESMVGRITEFMGKEVMGSKL